MKIFKKIIKWTILACIAAFFLTWWGAMLKNYILTVKYKDIMENMVFHENEEVPENKYERILSYSEDEIKTYWVWEGEHHEMGGTATYRRSPNGKWSYRENILWSTEGNADKLIWPYWHHCFKYLI